MGKGTIHYSRGKELELIQDRDLCYNIEETHVGEANPFGDEFTPWNKKENKRSFNWET
jgi:hypothetical protein